ncbi:1-phosphofructokinase [Anaerostipes faecalis]|uniref:1-phosphofructokinase n=1 Tax=Anaerostipes faecalis TaxID=2738446 RepID=UPI003F0645E5
MIYTLTTNPAIDMNITTDGLKRGLVNRTFDTVYTPNGKGVNVTLTLKHFGIESTVTGFFGGFSGKYIVEELENRGVTVKPVWVEDTTRINIFLNDGEGEFKLVNSGSQVDADQQDEMIHLFETADDCDCLVISGSLPPGITPSYYEGILSICKEKGIDVVLDISSPKLKDLLKYEPLLIKPNDEEIEEIFGIKIENEKDVVRVLHFLKEQGAKNVLLTLGDKGAYFSNGDEIYYSSSQPIKLLSSACAGDAALASFLSIWLKNPDKIEDAMRRSAATGANVAESNALGDFASVDTYFHNIKVRKVEG